jgi:RNA polymerase sigma-70 factor (ECF subfamily)
VTYDRIEALFHQSHRPIVQALALVCGDLAAAEDATQDAFARAWIRWSRISCYDKGAWVRRVAIDKLRNAHRSLSVARRRCRAEH